MSHTKSLVLGALAATLLATGAYAAVTPSTTQPFGIQSVAVQPPGAGVDRHECRLLRQNRMGNELPVYCTINR